MNKLCNAVVASIQKRRNVVSGLIYLTEVVHLHIRYVGVFPPTASSGNLAKAGLQPSWEMCTRLSGSRKGQQQPNQLPNKYFPRSELSLSSDYWCKEIVQGGNIVCCQTSDYSRYISWTPLDFIKVP